MAKFDPMQAVMELAGGVYGNRQYLAPGEEPPGGVEVKTGPQGGRYYQIDGQTSQAPAAGGQPRKGAGEVLGMFVEGRDFPPGHGKLLTQKQTAWLDRTVAQALRGAQPVGRGGMRSKDGTVTQWADGTVIATPDGSTFLTKPQRNGTTLVTRMTGGQQEQQVRPRYGGMPDELQQYVREVAGSVPPKEGSTDRLLDLYHSAVGMYGPGGKDGRSSALGSWINAIGGDDFLQSQNARGFRKKAVYDLIADALKEQGDKMSKSSMLSVVDLAAEVSDLVAKAPGYQGRPGPDPKTFARKRTKEQHFAVHEDDSGERVPLPKERHYIKEGEEAPPSVFVQEGPRGGRFYEVPARGKAQAEEPAKEGAGSMAVVADQPSENPTREVKPTPSTSQTVDVEDPYESTIARIKEAMGSAKIPQAELLPNGRHKPGYEINARDDTFDVYGRGRNDEEASKVFRVVARALESSDELTVSSDEDHVVVEALKGDPAADMFDEGIDTELDPLLSEKAWSHDEAILATGLIAKGVDPSAVVAAISASRLERSL